jgi:hypothetical protein
MKACGFQWFEGSYPYVPVCAKSGRSVCPHALAEAVRAGGAGRGYRELEELFRQDPNLSFLLFEAGQFRCIRADDESKLFKSGNCSDRQTSVAALAAVAVIRQTGESGRQSASCDATHSGLRWWSRWCCVPAEAEMPETARL